MAKPFDASKFRKSITKSIPGMSLGFNDPTDWVSTGNFALNYLISGDFNKGIPLGKVTVFAGELEQVRVTSVQATLLKTHKNKAYMLS